LPVTVRVLGIYGSPREGGNSDLLLDRLLEGAREAGGEVSVLYARDLKIGGCLECGGCDETGECVVPDDMDKVYPLLEAAHIIVLASPVFFYNLPAQLKALIDRSQALWSRKRLRKPPERLQTHEGGTGYLVAVGATKGANLFQGCELTARYFFDALDMDYGGGLFFSKVEAKGEILDHPDAMAQAFAFGKKAVEAMKT
jgi:multimeric flavodoxin WrbA